MHTKHLLVVSLAATLTTMFAGAASSQTTKGLTRDIVTTFRVDREDAVITFLEVGEDGSVGVLEDSPVDHVSMLDQLVVEQGATPLELFLALAPWNHQVPAILVKAHEQAKGTDEPRMLRLRDQASNNPVVAFGLSSLQEFGADCSFSSDGQSYFDGVWNALGWNHHWYVYHSAWASSGWVASASTGTTSNYRAHVCNGGRVSNPSAKLGFSVVRLGGPGCNEKVVLDNHLVGKDRRAVWYQSDAPACQYQSWAKPQGTVGWPMRWAMGIMWP